MTITANPTRNEYTAIAGQTLFTYTFKIFEDTDLNVYVTPSGQDPDDDTDLTTAYTVTGVGDEDGGTINLNAATGAGDLVVIISNIPDSRTTDYQFNGDFLPNVVNDDFDRIVSLVKQNQDQTDRSLRLQNTGGEGISTVLPPAEAKKTYVWNDTGTEMILADVDLVAVQTLTDEAEASATAAESSATDAQAAQAAAETAQAGAETAETNAVAAAASVPTDAIASDGVAGRVIRTVSIRLQDGTNAATLKAEVTDVWNGETIAETDNIPKNGSAGSFALNSAGTILTIDTAELTVATTSANISFNTGANNLLIAHEALSGNTKISFNEVGSFSLLDITTVVDTSIVDITITYITSA